MESKTPKGMKNFKGSRDSYQMGNSLSYRPAKSHGEKKCLETHFRTQMKVN